MGRYYYGKLSGEYWFAVQSPNDPAYFKNKISFIYPQKCLEYVECCCFVEDMKDNYCKKCYTSYEEHFDELDDDTQENYKFNSALMYENTFIKYHFYDYELEFVIDKLNKIIHKLNEANIDIDKLGIRITKEQDGSIECYLTNVDYLDNIKNEKIQLFVSLWCLGKQIVESIKENGYSYIYCER